MDRGVIVGATLISASFLVAVLLNRSALNEHAPATEPPPPPACEPDGRAVPLSPKPKDEKTEACKEPASESPHAEPASP